MQYRTSKSKVNYIERVSTLQNSPKPGHQETNRSTTW